MVKGRRPAFTLVELLVVIGIIGVLAALLLPAVQAAREAARKMSCSNNAKQIGLALHLYHDSHSVFPPSSTSDVEQGGWIGQPARRHIHSWSSLILPYLEQSTLANQLDYSVSALDTRNILAASQVIAVYKCPSYSGPNYSQDSNYTRFSTRYAIGNYVALGSTDVGHIYGQNTGLFEPDGTMFPLSRTRMADVLDGLSNTLLVAETIEKQMMVWIDGGTAAVVALRYDPLNAPSYAGLEHSLNYAPYFEYSNPRSEYGPSSSHPGGVHHVSGDGAIRFLEETIDAGVYVALTTRDGGEPNRSP